jgi:hypothetical protein
VGAGRRTQVDTPNSSRDSDAGVVSTRGSACAGHSSRYSVEGRVLTTEVQSENAMCVCRRGQQLQWFWRHSSGASRGSTGRAASAASKAVLKVKCILLFCRGAAVGSCLQQHPQLWSC